MTREDYGSHTEADAGLWAHAHAEPDENPMTLADVADEESAGHVCSGYCDPAFADLLLGYPEARAAFEAAHREGQR